jgi:LPXTG-motif cell wall-anchored protein
VTGDDETRNIAIGACVLTMSGLALLFARRNRPNFKGHV